MRENIEEQIKENYELSGSLIENVEGIERALDLIVKSFQEGGKILIAGNGGSFSDASHFAGELVGRFKKERKSLPAMVLGSNLPTLTAISNDYSFEKVFEREVEAFAEGGDILFSISTSGNSENIVRALEKANSLGCKTIGLTGESGGEMKDKCDVLINVPSKNTPRIQEAHILIIHIISALVEESLSR